MPGYIWRIMVAKMTGGGSPEEMSRHRGKCKLVMPMKSAEPAYFATSQ
jgi:hypothetical protein